MTRTAVVSRQEGGLEQRSPCIHLHVSTYACVPLAIKNDDSNVISHVLLSSENTLSLADTGVSSRTDQSIENSCANLRTVIEHSTCVILWRRTCSPYYVYRLSRRSARG